MNLFKTMTFLLALSAVIDTCTMHPSRLGKLYRQASLGDLSGILKLIDARLSEDNQRIVVFPEAMRESIVKSNIEKKRLFVAVDKDKIIGYKKLFVIDQPDELRDILEHELRAMGTKSQLKYCGSFDTNGFTANANISPFALDRSICIYDGSDLTHPDYRGKGVNQQLTNYALKSIESTVRGQLETVTKFNVHLLYGLSAYNAGKTPGAVGDRTSSIIKSFLPFVNAIAPSAPYQQMLPISSLDHYRYEAFLPTFDSKGQLLPDDQSTPGYGCILSYRLEQHAK